MWMLLVPEAHHGGDDGAVGFSSLPFAYVQLAIIIAVAGLQAAWLVRDQQRRVNAFQFGEQIRKLLAAHNADRALKLCAAARSPITELARLGVETHVKGGDVRATLDAAVPALLKQARSGFPLVIALGLLANVEGIVLLARGFEEGAHGDFVWQALVPLSFLGFLTILNAQRWLGWERDLTTIREMVVSS